MNNVDLPSALQIHFGFPSFRAGQREAIEHALARRDALVVMPTGSGKSLCYQLPALLFDGTTLVISPLIALMKDQVDALTAANKPATFINSTLAPGEQRERLARLACGEYKIVYVAPERLRNADLLHALKQTRVELLAVDEAHCISQWGHDFRPDYMHLREFVPEIGKPPVFALTATATPEVQDDIVRQLGLARAERIVTGFNRPNLSFAVRYTPSVAEKLRELQDSLSLAGRLQSPKRSGVGGQGEGQSAIIYTGTRREAEEVAEFVNEVARIRAAHYHAGLDGEERTRTQDDFMRGRVSVIVATNAFGMGVDKPDIRAVIHYNLPATVEAYYQEVGRAGRDGKPARGVLLYSPEDRALQEWFIENDAPKPEQTYALYRTLPRGVARVSSFDLQRETGLSDTLLKLALRQLEIAGVVQRLGDERGAMLLRVENLARLDLSASAVEIERFRAYKHKKLAQMIQYAETNGCRRRFILDYFGDHGSADAPDCCDNHIEVVIQPTRRAESEDEWIPLVILETVRTLRRPLGRDKIAMIVRGSHAQEIVNGGHHRHKFHGKLKHLTLREIGEVIEQLVTRGYLKTIGGEYPVAALTPLGEQTLNARAAIALNGGTTASKEKRAEKKAMLKAGGTIERTLELAHQGFTVAQIAERRGFAISTIYDHLERLVADGRIAPDRFIELNVREQILAAMKQWDGQWLSSLKALLPQEISYDQIRFVVAAQKAMQPEVETTADQTADHAESGKDRAHAAWLLGESRSKENIAALVESLDDENGNVRRLAASALGKIEDTSAVGPLMELLSDEKPQVRQYAIKALGRIGHSAAVQALTRIKDDLNEKEYNRTAAVTALKRISSRSSNLVALPAQASEPIREPSSIVTSAEDAVQKFLSSSRPKPLRGPWSVGFALDFNSKFAGVQWTRTELGDLVYRFKYANDATVAEALATRLADFLRAHSEMCANLIVPIPSTKKDRAYDPVPLLAHALGKALGVAVNEAALVKTRATELQKAMTNLAQKQANVRGAFRVTDASVMRGRRILLLDDFHDSGATLAEATNVLLAAGAAEVYVLAVTKTIHSDQ
jgi:ATP-dependent DNA helicase RecQ